ncbi:uncharacterized protein F5891DRAFT_1027541 [Suillus fuscotomentosus]|uniref:Uncharacterized protein n=1 Tax=Suillus fuscotomentosus TaxID=1912939 RepID=A0AAD4HMJ5_9AGAM|nr:uncharacterized protein F5891DRAFT_1027541 [Suillus fuscotomentosus]KAG1901721.1 hypothetical protein F5891DRAFT_1027541 [Suillus fuscotomentosus]
MWLFNASYAARVFLSILQPPASSVTVAPSALPSITGVRTLTMNGAGMRVGYCISRKGSWWVRRGMDEKWARADAASGQPFIVAGCAMVMMSAWHRAIFELRLNPAAEAPDWPLPDFHEA